MTIGRKLSLASKAILYLAAAAAPAALTSWQGLAQEEAVDDNEVIVEVDGTEQTTDERSTEAQAETRTEDSGAQSTAVVNVRQEDKPEQSNSFLKPSAGLVSFEDDEHFAGGFLLELNLSSNERITAGPVLGVLYTNLDDNGTAALQDNDFFLQLPATLKVAFAPGASRKVRVGAHGGVNVIYSQAESFGDSGDDERFNAFASVGGDLDFRVSRAVEIGVRPDWTFLDDFDMFTVTLGLGVAI